MKKAKVHRKNESSTRPLTLITLLERQMEASILADLNERLYNRETAQIHIAYLQFPSPESSDI